MTTRWIVTGWPRWRRNRSRSSAGSLSCALGDRPCPVGDDPLLDQVPVVVVLVGPPAITVDVHGGVEVLHLDRDSLLEPSSR